MQAIGYHIEIYYLLISNIAIEIFSGIKNISTKAYNKGLNIILINQTPFFISGLYDLCDKN